MSAEPIIDAHHHIWWLESTPWLRTAAPRIFGEHDAIRRDYTIAEYAADAKPCGVEKSVYVQINVAPGEEVEEVSRVAAAGREEGLIQGVVAFADLAAPSVGEVLDRQLESGPVRGVRQQLHWHEEPAYRFAARPDTMLSPAWQRGLREVAARGLVFELQVFPDQYSDALRVIDQFDEVTFVLLHAGMLVDRSAAGWAAWRSGLQGFAARPNVKVKLSGLGTFLRRCSVEDWRPVVEETIAAFGPDRCMFGSNFPIEKLWSTYADLIDVFRRCLAGLDASERQLVLHRVASDVYRI